MTEPEDWTRSMSDAPLGIPCRLRCVDEMGEFNSRGDWVLAEDGFWYETPGGPRPHMKITKIVAWRLANGA